MGFAEPAHSPPTYSVDYGYSTRTDTVYWGNAWASNYGSVPIEHYQPANDFKGGQGPYGWRNMKIKLPPIDERKRPLPLNKPFCFQPAFYNQRSDPRWGRDVWKAKT